MSSTEQQDASHAGSQIRYDSNFQTFIQQLRQTQDLSSTLSKLMMKEGMSVTSEVEDVQPDPLRVRAGIGVAQQGEQRPAEPGARLHLGGQELQQLRLVHFQHLQGLGHQPGTGL
mgnify:CR=1 FL=1